MLTLVRLFLALAALSVAACCKDTNGLPDGKPMGRHAEQSPAACSELAQRFQQVLDQATGACVHDTDCACYNPVSAGAGCGGVTDATSAARLAELEREFHARDCPWPHQCAPWACTPRCDSGRCRN